METSIKPGKMSNDDSSVKRSYVEQLGYLTQPGLVPQQQWYSIQWELPAACVSLDHLTSTWRAVASHHPLLRTAIDVSIKPSHGAANISLLDQAPDILTGSHGYDICDSTILRNAQLSIVSSHPLFSVRLSVRRALVDRISLARISQDFHQFLNGLVFEPSPPLAEYLYHISQRDPEKARLYWQESLAGVETSFTYGLPRKRGGTRQVYTRKLEPCLVASIHRICSTLSVTLRDLFHAVWALVQYRHVAASDNTVIFAVSGRDPSIPGSSNFVGPIEQLYPLKIVIDDQLDFLNWIRLVQKTDQASVANAFIKYDSIKKQNPSLEPAVRLLLEEDLEIVQEGDRNEPFPLRLRLQLPTSSLKLDYYSDSPETGNLQVIADHLLTAMAVAVANPQVPLRDVDIVSQQEKTILSMYSQPTTQFTAGLVHHLFEEQAKFNPQLEAIDFEGRERMTYGLLNRVANQVARQLPCRRGQHVPICMERSPVLIVALLSVLKTGAAYVILDPDSPNERQKFIISDIGASFVLVDYDNQSKFPNYLLIETLISSAEKFEASNLSVEQEPSDTVYVIYTSGSTGRPKGVILEHASAYTGLVAFPKLQDLRQLLFHNPIFSAAQRSIFSTLKQGGCLCLARKENLTVHITEMIRRMRVNVIDVTPSTASLIDPDGVPSLRRMTVAGELINPAILPVWMDRIELLNAYGLSEVTQINWRHVMHKGQSPQNIGRPHDSTRAYVLVPGTLRLAAILEPGELCLGGHQLAKAYLNRPEKTQMAFLTNPFGPGRLYRTGDMVVTHPDGSIEMIGRIDFQVKINGQRVEPGETNFHLQRHSEVYDSCTVSATVAGKDSLVAVIVPRHDLAWSRLANGLRNMLRQILPSYMVPPYWLKQGSLPLNVNGKVDIPELRKMVESHSREDLVLRADGVEDSPAGPQMTPFQEAMRHIWATALSIAPSSIQLNDSFIGLGGTSLEAITAVSLARQNHLDIKVYELLGQSDLSSVAAAITPVLADHNVNSSLPFSLLPDSTILDKKGLEDAWPVTPFQEALVAGLVLGRRSYVYTRVIRPKTATLDAVKEAFREMVNRSILLRSTFIEHETAYLQIVRSQIDLPWQESDQSLEHYMQDQHSKTIELGGPFLKIMAFPTSELVVTIHHALFDHWSDRFLYEDLSRLLSGQNPMLRPPFTNFVRYIQSQDSVRSHTFWGDYLKDAEPSILGHSTGQEKRMTRGLSSVLQKLSNEAALPMGSLIYAAWVTVLSRVLKMGDIVFGVTLSGRDTPVSDMLRMDGPTMTVVPIRIRLSDNDTLEDIAVHVQGELERVSEFSHYGLRNIFRASNQSTSLFDTLVNVLVMPTDTPIDTEIEIIESSQPNSTEHVRLEVDQSHSDTITLVSTLDLALNRSIVEDIVLLLNSSATKKHVALKDLPLRTAKTASALATQPLPQFAKQGLAHELFEYQVAINGTKIALQNEAGETLTYAQLNEKANRFAKFLCTKHIGREDIVPLYLDKSLGTLIALFGIMKAGASFCPLDPANPAARNSFVLRDITAKIIITDSANVNSCPNLACAAVVLEDIDLDLFADAKTDLVGPGPDDLAYIIYTSGSSGMPKGVLVNHASVFAASSGSIEAADINDRWRSLWALNYAFDGAYFDVFAILGAGGTLCLAKQDRVFANLADLVTDFNITHLNVTPTIAMMITPEDVPTLQLLWLGGEPLHSGILETWATRMPVYSAYGPTEGTILVTITRVEPTSSLKNIGRPIRSTMISVLDPNSTLALPTGEIGELCIAGPQVARGYLNRPEATKAAFVTSSGGEALYRTGDLARQLPNGEFELFGRKDDQVKINGYRIELGEIENVIMATQRVEACIVVAATLHGKKQLAAICQLGAKGEEDIHEPDLGVLPIDNNYHLFQEVQANMTTLAHYMVPALWLPIRLMPLLPSGKTDRKKLIAFVESIEDSEITKYQNMFSPTSAPGYEAAESSQERLLQRAWSSVLGKEADSISVTARFHSLGGDSITAINLVSRCRKAGFDLAVGDVMAFPTIREQAQRLKTVRLDDVNRTIEFEPSKLVHDKLETAGVSMEQVEAIYPCLAGQAEFLIQGHTNHQFWQLLTVRRVPNNFDLVRWRELATRLTAMNEILRAMFLWDDGADTPCWVQVILKEPVLDLETIYYGTAEERQQIIDSQWNSSFKIGKPFVQYRILLSRTDATCDLYIKLDHGMYDGTLLRIFDDQFTAMAHNKAPPKSTEFRDLIQYHSTCDRKTMLSFWSKLLQGNSFRYPSHIQNPKVGAMLLRQTSLDVNAAGQRHGVTAPIIFQTAYTLLLARLAGTTDVTYDNLLTGRNVPLDNPQRINGNCANFLPFRAQFTDTTSVRSLLSQTQTLFWETTENGMVGLADIYNAMGVDRETHAAKTMFCFQPFEPPPRREESDMRWVVVAMGEARMSFNYAFMVEVFRGVGEYRVKFQWDERVMDGMEAEGVGGLYERILGALVEGEAGTVGDVLGGGGVECGGGGGGAGGEVMRSP
ncbi:hypothetical protein MMC30_004271 [Trapelia coarctata]|nr:hypothetical protein [Trapelia coarctata]